MYQLQYLRFFRNWGPVNCQYFTCINLVFCQSFPGVLLVFVPHLVPGLLVENSWHAWPDRKYYSSNTQYMAKETSFEARACWNNPTFSPIGINKQIHMVSSAFRCAHWLWKCESVNCGENRLKSASLSAIPVCVQTEEQRMQKTSFY